MEITYSKNPKLDFYIKTEHYPYTESKEIIRSLSHWWNHPMRNIKEIDREKSSNYDIDSTLPNSLGYSFEHKLKNGSFSFVYDSNHEIMVYGGLLVDGNDCYMHRLSSNPEVFRKQLGMVGATIIPHQIKQAYDMGLDTYNITFDEHRYFVYRWWRDKLWEKDSTYGFKYPESGEMISKFDFRGKQTISYTEQYLLSLDLNRPDINDFFTF